MTDWTIPEFEGFPKIARFRHEIVITEKIDGTNAQVWISDDLSKVVAGSRTRWITPEDDNYGFAKWVKEHEEELKGLGPGRHFGEWWGQGIQRNYGLAEKRFSLFNTSRWNIENTPKCCHVVPTLGRSILESTFDTLETAWSFQEVCLNILRNEGSRAASGFMKPEGIVIFHTASNQCFKITLEKDEEHKGSKRG